MTTLFLRTARHPILCRVAINSHFQSFSSTPLVLQGRSNTAATASPHTSISTTINGPSSTLPIPLNVPSRQPGQSYIPSYLFAVGKTYLNFYKTGIKNVYYNYKAARPIKEAIAAKHGSVQEAVQAGAISRSDFQLLKRSVHDLKRVPVIALFVIVCGEFTPLVIVALSASLLPLTCRLPTQVEKYRTKLEQRRAISFRNLTADIPSSEGVDGLQRMQLLHISWSLGLSSSIWDYIGGQLPGLPTGVLRRKVQRHLEYLKLDDYLIGRGSREMGVEELRMALVERGVDVMGKPEQRLRADLNAWLQSRAKVSRERLLLTRPSVWPAQTPKSN